MGKLSLESCYKKENISIRKNIDDITYKPKMILTVIDELTEIMETNDYKSQQTIQDSILSIARLGRAMGCHLVLAPIPLAHPARYFPTSHAEYSSYVYEVLLSQINKLNQFKEDRTLLQELQLPLYYINYSDEKLDDEIEYLKVILKKIEEKGKDVEQKEVVEEVLGNFGDIAIGDTMLDGGVVTYVGEPFEAECIKFFYGDNEEITVSENHLMKVHIRDINGNLRNHEAPRSVVNRQKLLEPSVSWISANDVAWAVNEGWFAFLADNEEVQIKSFEKVGKKMVRCIQVTNGEYVI